MAKPKNPVRPKPRPKPSPYQSATRLAQQVVSGQYGAINQQTKQANAQLTAARDALIRELQAGIAPAGQAFDAAVGQQQALAQAGAAGLAAANPNAQIQETLQSIGAPVEQQQQIGQLTQAAFPGQGGVLNIQEGTVPGASLVAQKSAAQQFLAGLPAVAGLSGDQSLRALATQAQLERAKIAGQVPSLALSIQQQQERAKEAALDRAFRAGQARYEAQQDALDRAFQREQFVAQQKQARQQTYAPQIVGSSETGYFLVDPNTGKRKRIVPPSAAKAGVTPEIIGSSSGGYFLVNPQTGAIVKQITKPSGGEGVGTSGMTPTQLRSARADARQNILNIREARRRAAKGEEGWSAPSYNQALQQAMADGVPAEIMVPLLNKIFRVQYVVTSRGTLKQTGIKSRKNRKK